MKASSATNSHPTIALLQLTRLGDLIQTVQAVQNFKNAQNLSKGYCSVILFR